MHLVKKRVMILNKEEGRQRRKKIIIIILAILVGYILIFRIPWLSMIARYDTPEKATAVALGIKPSQITNTIEYKDVAFVIWEKSDYQTNYDFVTKDERGWIPKTESNSLGKYYSTLGKGYNLTFFSHDFTKIFYGKCRKPLKLKGFFERNKIRVKKVVAVAFFILSGKMKSVNVSDS